MRVFILTLFIVFVAQAQPYNPVVLWDRSGAGDSSRYGVRIVPLDDQNGDGYNDFAVIALGWGGPGQSNEALTEFFHGGNPPDPIPYMIFRGQPSIYRYWGPVGMGDLNSDGKTDWMDVIQYYADQDHFVWRIFWGGIEGDTIPDLMLIEPVNVYITGVGDFNGDGYGDVFIYHEPPLDFGEILYGGTAMDTIPDWIRHSPAGHPYEALPQSFGDIDGDGYSDFISTNGQSTFIFLGGAFPDTIPAYTWLNSHHTDAAIVSSLNADGFADLVFRGYPHWTIHLGGESISPDPTFVMNFYGNCSWNFATGLGDINSDGYNDMCAIDPGCNNLWGTLGLYLGHPWLNADPAVVIQGRTGTLNLVGINTAAGLGDVNGDGLNDWAIGAFNSNFDGFRGRVVILSGDTSLHVGVSEPRVLLPHTIEVSAFPNPFNSSTTIALSLPVFASDVDIEVFNVLGQKMLHEKLRMSGGRTVHQLNATAFATGLYFLHVISGDLQSTTKLMVLR